MHIFAFSSAHFFIQRVDGLNLLEGRLDNILGEHVSEIVLVSSHIHPSHLEISTTCHSELKGKMNDR